MNSINEDIDTQKERFHKILGFLVGLLAGGILCVLELLIIK